MDINWRCWIFCVILIGFGVEAESLQRLTCNVTQQADGSFVYLLSHSPSSFTCPIRERCWEDHNKTVLARGLDRDHRVHNVTDKSIVLQACEDHVRYRDDCLEDQTVDCRVNCSYFAAKNHLPPTVNSTSTCFFGSFCPSPVVVVSLFIGIGVVVVLIVLAVFFRKKIIFFCQKRRNEPAVNSVSYSSANKQIEIDIL